MHDLTIAEALLLEVGWVLFLAALSVVLPGATYQGPPEHGDGSHEQNQRRLRYKCNGFRVLVAALAVLVLTSEWGVVHWWDSETLAAGGNRWMLFAAASVLGVLLSLAFFVRGLSFHEMDTVVNPMLHGAKREGLLTTFFEGAELNPRLGALFDIKLFWYRPGFVGLAALVLAGLAAHQGAVGGGGATKEHAAYALCMVWFVADYLWHEHMQLYTFDIIAQKFGFALIWGMAAFFPFLYSVHIGYLRDATYAMAPPLYWANLALFAAGYVLFRRALAEKYEFRTTNKLHGREPKTIAGRLLISGTWGVARHFNYVGDLLMCICVTLPCGFDSWVPWLYPAYMWLMLLSRIEKDDARCREKYRERWVQYVKAVPYKLLPYVY